MSGDGSRPLNNRKHEAFACLVASGGVKAAAAYRLKVSNRGTAKSSHEGAARLSTDGKVAARIQWLRDRAAEKAAQRADAVTLTMAEKLAFCARVVKLNGASIDEENDGDLINGVSYDATGRRVLKVPCKLAALKLHNDLAGDGSEAKGQGALAALVAKLRR